MASGMQMKSYSAVFLQKTCFLVCCSNFLGSRPPVRPAEFAVTTAVQLPGMQTEVVPGRCCSMILCAKGGSWQRRVSCNQWPFVT